MVKEKEFCIYDVDSNRMIRAILTDNRIRETVNDSLPNIEITSVSSQ